MQRGFRLLFSLPCCRDFLMTSTQQPKYKRFEKNKVKSPLYYLYYLYLILDISFKTRDKIHYIECLRYANLQLIIKVIPIIYVICSNNFIVVWLFYFSCWMQQNIFLKKQHINKGRDNYSQEKRQRNIFVGLVKYSQICIISSFFCWVGSIPLIYLIFSKLKLQMMTL